MKIKHYLTSTSHFIPIQAVPVVAPVTHLEDAFVLMKSHGTSVAVIQRSGLAFDLFAPGVVATAGRPIADNARVALMDVYGTARLTIVEDETELHAVRYTQLASGLYTPALHLAGISRGKRILGLLSREEEGVQVFFTPAVYYQCSKGHVYFPPPPSTCPVDGSAIGIAS